MRIGKSRLNLTAGIRLSKNIFFGDGISGALAGRGIFGTTSQALAISPQFAQGAATFGTTSAAQLPYLAQGANTFGTDYSATAISQSFEPEYQAVLDYATLQGYSLPTSEQQALQNQLMIDLKAAATNGLASYHVVNIWANNTGNNNFGTIQWQDQSTQSTLNNSPTYTSNEGIRGDGVAAFYDTLFAPSTGNQNDIMYGLWYMNNRVDTTEGMTNGVRFHLRPRTTGNEMRSFGINSSTGLTTSTGGSINSSVGFAVVARDTSTVIELYKNGTLLGSGSDTSITPTSLTICGLCRRTGAGGTANHNTSLQAFTIIAKATEINQSNLYNALNDYISAI